MTRPPTMSRLDLPNKNLAEKQPSDPDHQCARGSFLSEKLLLVSSHHLTIQEREKIPSGVWPSSRPVLARC